ncbi:PhzF family phenazine biosynthesis protein [Shewanella sp. KCT]|uniref:PhzF family phenazine biosynthesis protein n=1 Tax=Shewanella sp. KCT TaxID=2569535 RepID=UPI001183DBCF|nr:PhzF family phenazine biosynthesis protein [Shewanella sp. KCT]TVP08886.1 phenazine biosynthesis protein PhzF [Shewanella sp. KCT]
MLMVKLLNQGVDVYLMDAFTFNERGGNPAGVVFLTSEIADEEKLLIANQVGVSETAFVIKRPDGDFDVTFFTPEAEVDFCGHATLATFFCMRSLGFVKEGEYRQHTKAGMLNVVVTNSNIVMEQVLPTTRIGPSAKAVSEALGVSEEVILRTGLPIEIVSTGLPDIIVPVEVGMLDRLNPDYQLIENISREYRTIGLHVFELSHDGFFSAQCRNYAPLFGINEEAATGSASGALGCYLVKHTKLRDKIFRFGQGRAMKSQSMIQVMIDIDNHSIVRVRVGGTAKLNKKVKVII